MLYTTHPRCPQGHYQAPRLTRAPFAATGHCLLGLLFWYTHHTRAEPVFPPHYQPQDHTRNPQLPQWYSRPPYGTYISRWPIIGHAGWPVEPPTALLPQQPRTTTLQHLDRIPPSRVATMALSRATAQASSTWFGHQIRQSKHTINFNLIDLTYHWHYVALYWDK